MNKTNELSEKDLELLRQIETIVQKDEHEQEQANSLFGFCSHIASTVPQSDTHFKEELYIQITSQWQESQSEKCLTNQVIKPNSTRVLIWAQEMAEHVVDLIRNSNISGGLIMKKRLVLLSSLILVTILFTVAFVPGVKASLWDVIWSIGLGDSSEAVQVTSIDMNASQKVLENTWIIRTEIGNYGGNLPPETDSSVRTFGSLVDAQALTSFYIKEPTALTEEYYLREIKLPPENVSPSVYLFYAGSGSEIIIVQTMVGIQPSDSSNVVTGVATTLVTDGELEGVEFDGYPAVWADGHILMWEADGISYQVGGLDINLQQAINIASSLR